MSLRWAPGSPDCLIAMTVTRLNGEPLTKQTRASDPQNEATVTAVLLEVLTRKIDRFVASAMDLPEHHRHERQGTAIDKAAGVVVWVDSANSPALADCSRAIQAVIPSFLYLCGRVACPVYGLRKREWEDITGMADVLKSRILANSGASCHTCLRPTALCTCSSTTNPGVA